MANCWNEMDYFPVPASCKGVTTVGEVYFADPKNCRAFIFCSRDTPMSYSCPASYRFDLAQKSCVPDSSCK
jgi:hypothetical protein